MLINLTPHALTIHTPDGIVPLPPSGQVARVATVETTAPDHDGIPVVVTSYGQVVGLPGPIEGVMYIVSGIVADAARRPDVASPGALVRGPDGQPTGCRGLARRV